MLALKDFVEIYSINTSLGICHILSLLSTKSVSKIVAGGVSSCVPQGNPFEAHVLYHTISCYIIQRYNQDINAFLSWCQHAPHGQCKMCSYLTGTCIGVRQEKIVDTYSSSPACFICEGAACDRQIHKMYYKHVSCEFAIFRVDTRLCKLRHTPAARCYRCVIL